MPVQWGQSGDQRQRCKPVLTSAWMEPRCSLVAWATARVHHQLRRSLARAWWQGTTSAGPGASGCPCYTPPASLTLSPVHLLTHTPPGDISQTGVEARVTWRLAGPLQPSTGEGTERVLEPRTVGAQRPLLWVVPSLQPLATTASLHSPRDGARGGKAGPAAGVGMSQSARCRPSYGNFHSHPRP